VPSGVKADPPKSDGYAQMGDTPGAVVAKHNH